MSIEQIRNYLGIFFLGTTAALGAYIILFQETAALPIASKDAMSAFQIIIPTFIAQLTMIFRWIANPPPKQERQIALPRWAVVGPPVAVIIILVVAIALIVWDEGSSLNGGTIFKNAVTFCVSLIGASTVFVIVRVFGEPAQSGNA